MESGKNRRAAYVNLGIIAVNVAVFLYLEMRGSTENPQFMVLHGALYEPAVLYEKEYWRLVTAVFMHFGMEHLVNNLLLLFVLGDSLERALGKLKYAVFYLICGVGANAVSLYVNGRQNSDAVSAGASGAIFGVIGGLLYAVAANRGRLEDLSTRQMVVLAAFALYHGFTGSGVDNAAHVAGLLIGVAAGAALYRKPEKM